MNNETPTTIEDAFEAASETLTSTEETPSEEPDKTQSESESEEETPESPEEDTDSESKEEEADFLGIDGDIEKMTSEELLGVKKTWQQKYTQKRQAERQELEDLRSQVAEKGKVEPAQAETAKPVSQMNQNEYAQYVADMAKAEVRVAEDNAYIEAQEKSFYETDSRLNKDNPEFNQDLHDLVILRLANERDSHEAEGKPVKEFDFIGRSKELIGSYDTSIKQIKQDYLTKQSKIARTKSEDFAKTAPKTSGAKTKKKNMNLDEAIAASLG